MAFDSELMADPVMASDGITYERHAIELWMKTHDVSPLTNKPFDHKYLSTNITVRNLIADWCEQNSVPVPTPPKRETESAGGGVGPALVSLLTKPQVTCSSHPKEQLRAFCTDCCRAVCVLCAVDVKRCKAHGTEALDTLIEDLKTEREAWSLAQEECCRGVEHVCLAIQADADAKKQAIDSEATALQQQVRAAGAERAAAFGAIVQKRQEREELVAAAAASPDIGVSRSPAAAVVLSALNRAKGAIATVSAAEFRAAAAPANAVGRIDVAAAFADPEDAAANPQDSPPPSDDDEPAAEAPAFRPQPRARGGAGHADVFPAMVKMTATGPDRVDVKVTVEDRTPDKATVEVSSITPNLCGYMRCPNREQLLQKELLKDMSGFSLLGAKPDASLRGVSLKRCSKCKAVK
jgi:hypothetical protein